jgi:L-fuculose-phosphate aldolase
MGEHHEIRAEVCRFAKRMYEDGMVVGTAGNVSARVPDAALVAITPSSLPYEDMTPDDIVLLDLEGNTVGDGRPPSFEKTVHLAIYHARADIGAVLHTHALYCSVLACLQRPLPPVIEELVPYVGGQVDVATYGMSGSSELAANIVAALGEKSAALVANHGNVCCGKTLAKAFKVAQLVERVARIYVTATQLGEPKMLPADVLERELMMYDALKNWG